MVNEPPSSRQEIKFELAESHHRFDRYLMDLSDEAFEYSPSGAKWNAGQHLAHIHLSLSPLRKIMRLPKWFFSWKWGTANRSSRSFQGVKDRYLEKLASVPKGFSNPFDPHKVMVGERAGLCAGMNKSVKKVSSSLNRFSEEDLDRYILPHPLLGKVTVREMMFNIIYHVQHHQELIEKQLKARDL